jgi:hypothetical protein
MLKEIWSSLGQPIELLNHVSNAGEGELPSVYAVTDLAVASISAATLSMAHLIAQRQDFVPEVQIDRILASRWFSRSIAPIGWELPPTWDSVAGDYETSDGWIKLHTNAPHHRDAALRALRLSVTDHSLSRKHVAEIVRAFKASELEQEIILQGGCAAEMRSVNAWAAHPQGKAVRAEPLLGVHDYDLGSTCAKWDLHPDRPLRGIRILDLTRILAGPVATRFLASYGADVLRLDPIEWDEPVVAPEVTLGKRRARLDLRSASGKKTFETLLRHADVIVHGYRSDALEKLGLGEQRRRELNPGLVDVSLDAYGWTGPWQTRRGFDSLVQMSSGIAEAGMRILGKSVPTPLPVQALDHATGYMLAASVIRGLVRRVTQGGGSCVRASLARTAAMLNQLSPPRNRDIEPLREELLSDYANDIEHTPWGAARRLLPPYSIDQTRAYWELPAGKLGDGAPVW